MACTALQSILKSCDNSNGGGLKSISVYDWNSSYTAGTQYTGTSVSVEFQKENGSLTINQTSDLATGSISNQITLTVTIPRRDTTKLAAIKLMGQGQRDLMIAATDSNGYTSYIGLERGANLVTVATQTGAKVSEGNNYTLTFQANEATLI